VDKFISILKKSMRLVFLQADVNIIKEKQAQLEALRQPNAAPPLNRTIMPCHPLFDGQMPMQLPPAMPNNRVARETGLGRNAKIARNKSSFSKSSKMYGPSHNIALFPLRFLLS
jgi:hypothetical protein